MVNCAHDLRPLRQARPDRVRDPQPPAGAETILDVIGKDLDDQLRTEAWNAYTVADPDATLGLLQRFYDRTDAGRA